MMCSGSNARGERCGMAPLRGSTWCWAHSPEKAAERLVAARKGGQNRQTPKTSETTPPESLRDFEGIRQGIDLAWADALLLENSERRTRALVAVLQTALQVHEQHQLRERLDALEAQAMTGPRRVA